MPVLRPPAAPTHRLAGTSFTSLATPATGSMETAVWRVTMDAGTRPTAHSMTRGEVFVVLRGVARVRIGGRTQTAGAGDVIVVPADTELVLANDGAEVLEALCCMPVGGQARVGDAPAFTPPWAE